MHIDRIAYLHRDLEFARRRGKHPPGLVVGKRVLLSVDEVLGGLDLERMRWAPSKTLVMDDVLQGGVAGQGQAHLKINGLGRWQHDAKCNNSSPPPRWPLKQLTGISMHDPMQEPRQTACAGRCPAGLWRATHGVEPLKMAG